MAKKHGRTGAAQGSTGVGQERKNNPSVHEEDEEEEFSFNTGNPVIEGLHESSGSDADEDDSDESGEEDEEGDSDDDASDHNGSAEVTKAIAEYYKAARYYVSSNAQCCFQDSIDSVSQATHSIPWLHPV